METHSQVESLFSEKASSWSQKYQPGGPLHSRLNAFTEHLAKLLSPPARVLDFGCGTGNLSSHLSARGYRVTACDLSDEMIAQARERTIPAPIDWHLLPVAWKKLPFESNTFDAIVASSVFEYVPDVVHVLEECCRVLRPNGVLIATVPNTDNLVRKIERLIRPIVITLASFPPPRAMRRLQSYASYLRCSRNRMSIKDWIKIAESEGFETADAGSPKKRVRNPALVFLRLRKRE